MPVGISSYRRTYALEQHARAAIVAKNSLIKLRLVSQVLSLAAIKPFYVTLAHAAQRSSLDFARSNVSLCLAQAMMARCGAFPGAVGCSLKGTDHRIRPACGTCNGITAPRAPLVIRRREAGLVGTIMVARSLWLAMVRPRFTPGRAEGSLKPA